MPNLARSKLVRRRRAALLIVAVTLAAAVGIYAWFAASSSSSTSLRHAGSTEIIGPIGQIQLVAAMDPPEGYEKADGDGVDPASIPDARLQVDVAVKLDEMGLPVEPLDITVDSGLVTLEGRVEDALLRDAIEVAVRSVAGVREVQNRLGVVGGE